jgi:ubiquinone/menaquinone biosynthesis C-methylase UbiE
MQEQAMIEIGENKLFHPVLATAENTTLPDNSIDLITVGQAFHRFDAELFKKECKRILKKDARVAILYNN